MHVTSNPSFAFHDDVFPAFAKIFQQFSYPKSASSISIPFPKTIVPDNFFGALAEFEHISTLKLRLNGTERFEIEFDLTVSRIESNIFIKLLLLFR